MPVLTSLTKPEAWAAISRRSLLIIILLFTPAILASVLLSPGIVSALAGSAWKPEARESSKPDAPETTRTVEAYGKLPLRFEANRGQTSSEVEFISRGSGYTLFLTPSGAVLRLRMSGERSSADASRSARTAQGASTFRISLAGSNPRPIIVGEDELAGRSNYLTGEAHAWLTNVPNFERVRYKSAYPGIDLVYYGNQGRLEYDFHVAPGADSRRIRLRFDGARGVRLDKQGELVISTEAGEIRQQPPRAYQEAAGGGRDEVRACYRVREDGRVAIEVGAYDRSRALVIDPVLIYSTYLGGSGSEQGLGVAVGSDGSAYVAGSTGSTNFPGPSPIQGGKDAFNDAFILKLNPAGNALVYATYLGGNGDDIANAIAVDAAGNAYVAGLTGSGSFPRTAGAFQEAKDGGLDAFVTKLNSTGTVLAYSTYLGGNANEQVFAIAVDAAGAAYVAGSTNSINFTRFPVTTRAGNPVLKSTDSGANWAGNSNGLTASTVNDFAVLQSDSNVVYAATNLGVYKTTDGGAFWQLTGTLRTSTAPVSTRAVTIDPSNPNIIYAATQGGGGLYKSTDGGTLYEVKNSGLITIVNALAIDPTTPSTLYAGTSGGIFKSTNGGDTWAEVRGGILESSPNVNKLVIDPTNPQVVYAATTRGMYKTTNGGGTWATANNGLSFGGSTPQILALRLDPSQTSTLYASVTGFIIGVYKSTDGGASWTASSNGLTATINGQSFTPSVNALLVDPAAPATIYAGTIGVGIYKTTDGGANWTTSNNGLTNKNVLALAARGSSPLTILAGTNIGNDGFVAKLNPAGSQLAYLNLLGGSENDDARGIAVDSTGSAYVTGQTSSTNFPVANAYQAVPGGGTDSFITKLSPAGDSLVYSTYLGGGDNDNARAIAVGTDGSAYVTGSTISDNFPLANALQAVRGGGVPGGSAFSPDAFITKLNPSGSTLAYSTYLGAEGSDQGFGIAVSADGSAYVTGITSFSTFPVVNPVSPQGGGNSDAFVTRVNPSGTTLRFSTFLGGAGSDQGNAVAVDAAGAAYVVGNTTSSNFPVPNGLSATYGGSTDAFITKISESIELGVTMTDAPDPVVFGNNLTYTIDVKNNGELPATGVTLTDTLPAGATFVSASAGQGTCSGTSTVTCALGTLNVGASTTVTIIITPPAVRTINNTASVASNEIDPVPANNTATQSTQVNFADLSLMGATAYQRVAPGARINYLFRVTNNSGGPADSVMLTDNLPAGTTFVSCSAVGGVCGGSGNNRTVTFASLAVGQSATVVLVATVNASIAEGTILSNTATAASTTPDPNNANNSTTVSTTVTATPLRQKTNGLIAFSTGNIITARADGSQPPILFPGGSNAALPRWSPDGARLAFVVGKTRTVYPNDTFYAIEVKNADGTGLLTLADNSIDTSLNNSKGFSWSPDGTRIAYIGTDRTIYIANTDGSGYAKLPDSPAQVQDIDWSPDGSRFVFSKGYGEIYVMNVDGSELTKLVPFGTNSDGPTQYVGPRWSPDMTKILFTQLSNNYSDAFIMNSDGTNARRLLNNDTSFAPAWSPDGTRVAFYQGTEVHVINLDGTGEVTLATNEGCCDYGSISWQPIPTNTPLTPPGQSPQTFSISGRVTSDNNAPLFFSTLTLTGTRNATIHTKTDGQFEFVNLPAGGNYTITASNVSYNFTPASRTFNNLGSDQTGADFVGAYIPANITGRVTDNNGNPLAGIKVNTWGGYPEGSTMTDANGFYSFPNVQRFRTYFVAPDPFTPYNFTPASYTFQNLTTSQVANFVGSYQPSHVISGRVVEAGENGPGIAGIQVNLGEDGVAVTQTFTDANGSFTFGDRQTNHQYSVSIFNHPTYIFEPIVNAPTPFAEINIPRLASDQNLTFTGARRNTVQFASAATSGLEGDGRVQVLVTRSGDTSAAATVNYSTTSGTASQSSDYTTTVGTLKFAAGETGKSIKVILTDDAYVEPTESFTLTLDSPVGAQFGATKAATINITDNDTATAATNPIDDARFFVRQNYADFLSREPDQGGLDYWTERITQCGTDASCINFWRSAVSAAFFIELEFQNTGSFVYRLYKASYGTRPTYGQFTPDRARVVDSPDPEQSKQTFALLFVQRPEFTNKYAPTLNGAAFVDALLQNVLQASQVDLTGQRDALLSAYNAAGSDVAGRATVLRQVADNQSYVQSEYNKAFVLMQYFGFLKRNPDEGGYQFWLNVVNNSVPNDPSGYRSMVCAFITSPEYQQRFSGVITRSDNVCAPQ